MTSQTKPLAVHPGGGPVNYGVAAGQLGKVAGVSSADYSGAGNPASDYLTQNVEVSVKQTCRAQTAER